MLRKSQEEQRELHLENCERSACFEEVYQLPERKKEIEQHSINNLFSSPNPVLDYLKRIKIANKVSMLSHRQTWSNATRELRINESEIAEERIPLEEMEIKDFSLFCKGKMERQQGNTVEEEAVDVKWMSGKQTWFEKTKESILK